ncbi:hypothetical protein TNCV_3870761 [Trichonephila clavipes]|nr:hypothetical protein TNCV_3870761 [Trichonephila clavipes]
MTDCLLKSHFEAALRLLTMNLINVCNGQVTNTRPELTLQAFTDRQLEEFMPQQNQGSSTFFMMAARDI